jgi:hypothetical protein
MWRSRMIQIKFIIYTSEQDLKVCDDSILNYLFSFGRYPSSFLMWNKFSETGLGLRPQIEYLLSWAHLIELG